MKQESPKQVRFILHPFLFASFASLSLLATNLTEIGLAGLRAFLLSLIAALLTFLILRLILKDSLKAGLCSSGTILLIASYGHVIDLVQNLLPGFSFSQSSLVPLVLWVGFIAAWFYVVLKVLKNPLTISNYLNIVALVLNIFPVYAILTFSSQTANVELVANEFVQQNRMTVDEIVGELDGFGTAQPRDVYFIVLDAYAREDVLKELYDYDNSEFVEFLRSRGFFVDSYARANYHRSEFSIASTLNFMHINSMPEFMRQHNLSVDEENVRRMSEVLIRNNLIKAVMQGQGYQVVEFDNGFGATSMSDVDHLISSPEIESANLWQLGFEFMLLDTTLGREVIKLLGEENSPHRRLVDAHRERVLYTLGNLSSFADREGAYFIYSHILSPHVPYVFGPNGEQITGYDPYTLLDAQPGNEANITLYRDQVHYLNTLVMEAIDEILAKSSVTPIIILQADHGSKVYNDINPPTDVRMDLQLPILSATLLPGISEEVFENGFTPVNNFLRILNQYGGSSFEMLENTSYILERQGDRVAFINACESYQACSLK